MTAGPAKGKALSLALLLFLPAACAPVWDYLLAPMPSQGTTLRGERGKSAEAPSLQEALERAEMDLDAGQFERALDGYGSLLDGHLDSGPVRRGYGEALERVHRRGRADFERNDCAAAGPRLYLLLTRMDNARPLLPDLSFTEQSLLNAVETCREELSKTGLEEYRQGRLAGAIAAWEKLLLFDPGNEEIRKAIDTARVQLRDMGEETTPAAE